MSEPTPVPDEPNADENAGPDGQSAHGADLDAHSREVLRWRAQSRQRNGTRDGAAGQVSGTSSDASRDAGDDAPGRGVARAAKKKRPWWVELPVMIVIAFLATFLIQTFIARVYYVPSGSMEQTLHGVEHGGDRILAYKLGYDYGTPKQGDVVVFKGPPSWPEATTTPPTTWLGKLSSVLGSVIGIAPPGEKDFVKRVIAVGGQTISCCDAQGRVQVDGVPLTEPYIYQPIDASAWGEHTANCAVSADGTSYASDRCFGPYTVPKGYVWVMGDHRSDSADSTYHCQGLVPAPNVQCQGPIPVKDVIGRAVAIVMPPSRWGGVGSPDIMARPTSGSDK